MKNMADGFGCPLFLGAKKASRKLSERSYLFLLVRKLSDYLNERINVREVLVNGSKTHRLRAVIVFLFLLTVFLVSAYTFILQRNYSENTLESAVEWNTQCADAIHKLVLHKLTGEDYKNISTIADMQS